MTISEKHVAELSACITAALRNDNLSVQLDACRLDASGTHALLAFQRIESGEDDVRRLITAALPCSFVLHSLQLSESSVYLNQYLLKVTVAIAARVPAPLKAAGSGAASHAVAADSNAARAVTAGVTAKPRRRRGNEAETGGGGGGEEEEEEEGGGEEEQGEGTVAESARRGAFDMAILIALAFIVLACAMAFVFAE